jgi:hypothetical protein
MKNSLNAKILRDRFGRFAKIKFSGTHQIDPETNEEECITRLQIDREMNADREKV